MEGRLCKYDRREEERKDDRTDNGTGWIVMDGRPLMDDSAAVDRGGQKMRTLVDGQNRSNMVYRAMNGTTVGQ